MLINHRPRSLTSLGYVIECHGVQLRAQLRSVATLVRVTGRISPANRDMVQAHLARFTLVQGPLVVDLLDGEGFDREVLKDLLRTIRSKGSHVTLVVAPVMRDAVSAHDDVEVVDSVGEALRGITERINVRRALLMKSMAIPSNRRSASGYR